MLFVRSSVPLLVSVLGLGVLLSSCPAIAAPPAESPVATPGWSAEDHYRYATRSLSGGRNFARAALHLEEAVRLEPDNIPYRLALGCAYASRAASLVHTRSANGKRLQQLRIYPDWAKMWEEEVRGMQDEPTEEDILLPPPPLDTPYPTRDDNRPFLLTRAAFNTEYERLTRAAFATWKEAEKRAATPAEKAEAEYVHGWGILLINAYRDVLQLHDLPLPDAPGATGKPDARNTQEEDETTEATPPVVSWLPEMKQAVLAFERATKLAPDEARYWESLGKAHEMQLDKSDETEESPARTAYLTALRLAPRNAALWYKLGIDDKPTKYDQNEIAAEKRQRALEYLTQAARANRTNPAPLHATVSILFFGTPYKSVHLNSQNAQPRAKQELEKQIAEGRLPFHRESARSGLAALEQANLLPSLNRSLPYDPPVPPLLSAAWSYRGESYALHLPASAFLNELAYAVCGYARFLEREGDAVQARRASQAVITAAKRLMGDLPVRNHTLSPEEMNRVNIGSVMARAGYETRIAILLQMGHKKEAQQAENDLKAFEARLGEDLPNE